MDEQTITEAFRKLYKTRQELWQASEKTIATRIEFEKERAARLLTGEIVGKNEAERDARTRELLNACISTSKPLKQRSDRRALRMNWRRSRSSGSTLFSV